jgi:hypothetical protein
MDSAIENVLVDFEQAMRSFYPVGGTNSKRRLKISTVERSVKAHLLLWTVSEEESGGSKAQYGDVSKK